MQTVLRFNIAILITLTLFSSAAVVVGRLIHADILLFIAREGDQPDIFLIDVPHVLNVNLTRDAAVELTAAWSPDGEQIAFTSDLEGGMHVFIMDIDGRNRRRLTDNIDTAANAERPYYSPVWSPDGRRIAYIAFGLYRWEIYIVDADGTNRRLITDHYVSTQPPAWSPDGSHLAFVSLRDGSEEIYVINVEAGEARDISNHPARDYAPVWSPAGDQIVFISNRDPLDQLFIADLDGSLIRRLTHEEADHYNPAWSPDGIHILVNQIPLFPSANRIILIDSFTGRTTSLIGGSVLYLAPVWSPDGKHIVFTAFNGADYSISIIDADGADVRLLMRLDRIDFAPVWRPNRTSEE